MENHLTNNTNPEDDMAWKEHFDKTHQDLMGQYKKKSSN